MKEVPLKNPAELSARLSLGPVERLLLVDAPAPLEQLLRRERPIGKPPEAIEGKAIRSVKRSFEAILLWREDRAGSQALLEAIVKRLEPAAVLWVVTAMKKVSGPATPAARRLELFDLKKALSLSGLEFDREIRVSAWHVGYRFRRNL